MSLKKKIVLAGIAVLTAFSMFVGFKDRTPSAEELARAREVIKASNSYIIDYNKQMVPPKTFIKKGLEGEWDVVIKDALNHEKKTIRIPLLWANPLPENQLKEFKKILSEEFQRILDSNPSSKNLKVKSVELEKLEYDLHHPKGMFKKLPGQPVEQLHRIAFTAEIRVERKLF